MRAPLLLSQEPLRETDAGAADSLRAYPKIATTSEVPMVRAKMTQRSDQVSAAASASALFHLFMCVR